MEPSGTAGFHDVPLEAATETKQRSWTFGWRVVGGAATGVALALCFPPFHLPLLLPFALAVLLALLRGVTVREAAYIGIACGLTLNAIGLCWLTALFGAASVSLWAIAACYPMLACAIFVRLRGRLPSVPEGLLFALAWTGMEYFRSEPMWLNFTWLGLGYAVVDAPVLAAPAALIGSYGLTFLLLLFSALLLHLFSHGTRFGRNLCAALLLLWALLFLPNSLPTPVHPLHVRMVQANREGTAVRPTGVSRSPLARLLYRSVRPHRATPPESPHATPATGRPARI